MKEEGTKKKTGRKYSVISAPGCVKPEKVSEFKGKSLCIVFYPEKKLFTLGIKEFAAQREKFNEENCKVIACTADSSWSTWSTSVGLTLKGEMAAANLDKIREEAFLPDPTSYDIQTVSMVMLDEKQCIRHVMTTSLEPKDAVSCALEAARNIKKYNVSDPMSLREGTKLPNPGNFKAKSEVSDLPKKKLERFNCHEDEKYEPEIREIWKPDMSYKNISRGNSEFPPWEYIGYNLLMNTQSGEVKKFGEANLPLVHHTLVSRSVF